MTLSNAETIDAIGVDKTTGQVVLTVIDKLPWEEESTHLNLLQDKLNTYLSFIESGEIYASYPQAKDKPIVIKIVFKFGPNQAAESFLNTASEIIAGAGFRLMVEVAD